MLSLLHAVYLKVRVFFFDGGCGLRLLNSADVNGSRLRSDVIHMFV